MKNFKHTFFSRYFKTDDGDLTQENINFDAVLLPKNVLTQTLSIK
jgi:hypothetical protein